MHIMFWTPGKSKKVSAHGLIQLPTYRGAYIPHFNTNFPIHWIPLFSENYLNPQLRINKMAHKHTDDYHPNPSQLISRKNSFIFRWTSKEFFSPGCFWNFFLNVYIKVSENFQIYSVKVTSKNIYESKNWICLFSLEPQVKVSSRFFFPEITYSSRTSFPEDIIPQQKGRGGGRGLWSWKNYQNSTYEGIGHKFW